MVSWMICLGILLSCTVFPVFGDVFKYRDEHGNVIFTDKPLSRGALSLEWKRTTKSLTEENRDSQRRMLAYARVPSAGRPRLSETMAQRRGEHESLIQATALRYRLSPALLHAVIRAESAYDPTAVSSAGAIGLMQLIPATAERYQVRDIWSAADNLRGGAAYLRYLLDLFEGDLRLALAGYNAGENAVIRHGREIPPYPETQTYVRKVLQYYWAEQAALAQLSVN